MTTYIHPRDAIESAKEQAYLFWASMDATSDIACEDLFSEAGQLVIDPVSAPRIEVIGRVALAAFGAKRKETAAAGNRLTRHLVSNLRPVGGTPGLIMLSGHVTDYVGMGAMPLALGPPAAVADFDYEIVATGPEAGLLAGVRGRIVFAAAR